MVGDTIFTMGGRPVFSFAESNTNHGFALPRPWSCFRKIRMAHDALDLTQMPLRMND